MEIALPNHSDQRWRAMQGESIFLTGGTGLFGQWLVAAIVDANRRLDTDIKLTLLSREPAKFLEGAPDFYRDKRLNWVSGNVVDFTFPRENFNRIVHMATTSAHETFAGEDQLMKFKMLINGTERVLQLAAQSGAKNVFFASSGVAYGAYPDAMQYVAEDYCGAPDTMEPASALAQGKRAAEFLCAYYADKYEFNCTIARCFSFVGPGLPLNIHYAIGNFIRDALNERAITVKGDGSPMRSFLYLGDLVEWLLAIWVQGRPGQIYNVGSDQAISIKALAHLVRDLLAPEKRVSVLGDSRHNIGNFGRNWYVPDIRRSRAELGVDVWTSLEQAILKTAAL